MHTFISGQYTIKQGCKWYMDNVQEENVSWSKIVWERVTIPKHRFVFWLVMQGRLRTKEKLVKSGIIDDTRCLICGNQEENIRHLFFECVYSRRCLQEVMELMSWKCNGSNIEELCRWARKKRIGSVQRKFFYAMMAALVYHIWRVRNDALWQGKIWRVLNTVGRVEKEIQMRVKLAMPKKASSKDRQWAEHICTK